MKTIAPLLTLLLFTGCIPPEAPQEPSTVMTKIEVRGAPGYTILRKDVGALTLPYQAETPGELVWELEATPDPGYPEPVWTVTFPEEHQMTYHRRSLTVRLLKNSISLWVGPGP